VRASLALVAVLLAAGCGGGDDETAPAARWDGPAHPLPAERSLPVQGFEAYAQSVDEAWERSPSEVAESFARPGRLDGFVTIGIADVVDGATTADVRVDRLADDSVRTLRFELALERRDDGTWRVASADWSQRCQPGRGHRAFSSEPCV
jgi:hypothetical protein